MNSAADGLAVGGEVNAAIGFGKLRSPGGEGFVLGQTVERAPGVAFQDIVNELRAEGGQAIVQFAGGFQGVDGSSRPGIDEPGIHLLGEGYHGKTCFFFARQDGPVDGGSPPETRKQGSVKIDGERAESAQKRGRELLAKGDDDGCVGVQVGEAVNDVGGVDVGWLKQG